MAKKKLRDCNAAKKALPVEPLRIRTQGDAKKFPPSEPTRKVNPKQSKRR